jgi:histidine triad (HIT) family protein
LTLDDVPLDDWTDVAALALEVTNLQRTRLSATGTDLFLASGEAGEQSVFHLHLHVVPRHEADGLDLSSWWSTRVRSASPDELRAVATQLRGRSG